MTSFIIQAHENRTLPTQWTSDTDSTPCPFCSIVKKEIPSFVVYENEQVIAFLDILPLRRGHTLVVPKAHISRLSDLPSELARAVGEAVSKVARALTLALENTALNVVCNQEYAQAVAHVHYHVIPAPRFDSSREKIEADSGDASISQQAIMHQREFEARTDIDAEDAEGLAVRIRSRL